jgi:hypothetical protein
MVDLDCQEDAICIRRTHYIVDPLSYDTYTISHFIGCLLINIKIL